MVPGIVHLWGNSLLDYHVKISTSVDGFCPVPPELAKYL